MTGTVIGTLNSLAQRHNSTRRPKWTVPLHMSETYFWVRDFPTPHIIIPQSTKDTVSVYYVPGTMPSTENKIRGKTDMKPS